MAAPAERGRVSRRKRLLESENVLAAALLAPGVLILVLFIAYPFVMALWFSLTSIRVGDPGEFVGLANFTKA
jgi:multiple sugar transport system permease protein